MAAELEHVAVFRSGEDGYAAYRIPAIVEAADGTLIAFGEARKNNLADPGYDGQEIDLVAKRSTDGGATWSEMKMLHDAQTNWSAANPTPLLDRDTGRIWCLYLLDVPGANTFKARPQTDDCKTLAIFSDDSGTTWSEPVDLTRVARDMDDSTWCSTVIGPGGAVQDAKGRLLFPAWKYSWGNFCVLSEDHGQTWRRGEMVPGGKTGDENQLVELADGTILMDYRQNGEGVSHRWRTISREGGWRWSEPMEGETVSPVACAIERLDANRIVWTGPTESRRARLVLRTSTDEARSFDVGSERVIYEGLAAYSDLQLLRDGEIGVLWEKDNYQEIAFTRLSPEWLEGNPTERREDECREDGGRPENGRLEEGRREDGCRVEAKGEDLVVTANGKPFATYMKESRTKPVIFPIYGPTGKPMTRFWPIDSSVADEAQDHPHQRSLWLTHGEVNGVSFWDEMEGCGRIAERSRAVAESDGRVVLTTTDEWLIPDGSVVVTDRRVMTFGTAEVEGSQVYGIDFEVELTANVDEVLFGDTKEGTFGLRVWEEMRADRKDGDGGRIVNAEGLENDAAWGKRSNWVDYAGPVQGETVGILVMNHPTSFRAPTWWHVRTYGLFAANPFGIGDFTGDKTNPGDLRLKKGESITLKYRVLFHDATLTPEKMAVAFEAYAAS